MTTLAQDLQAQILANYADLTPHRASRGYVGMSGIGGCLYDLYMRARHAIPTNDQLQWYGWTGQLHEAAVKRLLGLDGEAVGTFLGHERPEYEIIAGFDSRYRGHIDTRLVRDNVVVDVKSTGWSKFKRTVQGEINPVHVAQVQAYMDHGCFDHGILVYIARDVPHRELADLPVWAVDAYRDEELMAELNWRAAHVLAALDGETDPPPCSCGYCYGNWAGVE